jgi:hypothetical protein
MALEFTKPADDESGAVIATERLCLTEDNRLVPDSDSDARWLFCTPGSRISKADADRYGLIAKKAESAAETAEPEAEQPKARRRPADKSRTAAGDK